MQGKFENFTLLIANINSSICKIKTGEMEEFDLRSPHVSCLYYLYKMESLTAKELCDICQENKAAISRSLEYLEESGYILCDSNLKKRYKSNLVLTSKGHEIGKQILIKIDSILDVASERLSEDKRKIMYECLNLINENLEKFCKKYEGEK